METITAKKSLGTIRRKAVDLSQFNPIRESQLSEDQLAAADHGAGQPTRLTWRTGH